MSDLKIPAATLSSDPATLTGQVGLEMLRKTMQMQKQQAGEMIQSATAASPAHLAQQVDVKA